MSFVIKAENLRKVFGSSNNQVIAVDRIDLEVKEGEIFGFLGPNGAGKTTTMKMLTTLLKPTSGQVTICGFDLFTQEEKVRTQIGYVSQIGGLERSATARENLILQARIFGFSKHEAQIRAQELINALSLNSFADRFVETYSGGQRRRADIALGMVNRPKLLFLDEPTIGLDPQSRAEVWQEMRNLKASGTTIFFTTHYMDEADLLCDRVAIVDHGKIIALDTPEQLKSSVAKDIIVLGFQEDKIENIDLQNFSNLSDIKEIIKEKSSLRFLVNSGEKLLPQLLRLLDSLKIEVSTISLYRPTLDDVFLIKTGRSLKEEQK